MRLSIEKISAVCYNITGIKTDKEYSMADIIEITDIGAKELTPYARLTEKQLKNRKNPDYGLFVAESRTVVELALEAGCIPVSLLIEKSMLATQARGIIEACDNIPVYTAEGSVLEGLTGFSLSRGIFALMKRPMKRSVFEVLDGAMRIAVLEDIMDATNVGAIMRSAAALGVDGVLLSPRCSDPLNRRSARVSMGTVFKIPWAYISEDSDDWPQRGLDLLKEKGFRIAAAALSDNSISVDDPAPKSCDKLAIVLGTEGTGLSELTVSNADFVVKIPMFHGVDSLNVAAASAVIFWELCRGQRSV